jgi:DNA-binding NarL/FixJ family response regulator
MNRLFVVADEAAVEPATRFARSCSSGLNLFAVTDGETSIREAVREAQPDLAVLVGDHAETAARQAREVADEAPSAVILVLTPGADGAGLDEVCNAAAMVCVAVASGERDLDSLAGEPTNGTPSGAHVNGNGTGPASPSTALNGAVAEDVARELAAEPWPLTPRELEVLCLAAEGHSNAQIGRHLWVTEQTVKFHLSNVYRKLDVSNRTEASAWAITRGLVSGPGSVRDPGVARAAVMAR